MRLRLIPRSIRLLDRFLAPIPAADRPHAVALLLAMLGGAAVALMDAYVGRAEATPMREVLTCATCVTFLVAILLLRRTGSVSVSANLACSGMWLDFAGQYLTSGDIFYLAFLCIVPVAATLFGSHRSGLLWLAVISLSVPILTFVGPLRLLGFTPEQTHRHDTLEAATVVMVTLGIGVAALWKEYLREQAQRRKAAADRTLEQERRRFATIAERAYSTIIEARYDGTIDFVSQGSMATLGYHPGELRGRTQGSFLHPEDRRLALSQLRRTPEGQLKLRSELRLRHGGGRWSWVEVAGGTYAESGRERRWILALRNIDRHRKATQQLSDMEKMRSLAVMAGGIAHDFNNLLTVIGGYSDLLGQGPAVQGIQQATSRASELTQRLLAFGHQQEGRRRRMALNPLLESNQVLLQSLAREDVEIRFDLDPDLRDIEADPAQLQQVLLNLATNARDALPEGGRIEIATSNVLLRRNQATALSLSVGPFVCLRVQDSGQGMEREILERAFEPFFTTKEAGRGTGLGLASVFGIVRQVGGGIELKSRPGQGTVALIYLPVAKGLGRRADNTEEEPLRKRATQGLGETVFVVEDQEQIRHLAQDCLAGAGYSVLTAANGKEALPIWDTAHPVDLVVCDVIMPEMRGPELVRRLREQRPDLKVLFISGYQDGELGLDTLCPGFTEFLAKPFRPNQLVDSVERLLRTS